MSSPDPIVILSPRWRTLRLGLLSAAFVAIGIWIATRSARSTHVITGIANIVFFGACSLYSVWRLVRPVPAVIIDSEGIIDRASMIGAGRVRWDEMAWIGIGGMGVSDSS